MNPEHESFADAMLRVENAVRHMYTGTSEPFTALWSQGDNSSLFGAFSASSARGWQQLEPTFPRVAGRYRDGTVEFEYVIVSEGVDLAYTVAFERAVVSIDGGAVGSSTIRATHVFRREDGRWMLVHRHGNFATSDDGPIPVSSSSDRSHAR